MATYKCAECGAVFDEGSIIHFRGSFYEPPESACPSCNGDDFDEAVECVYCERHFLDREMSVLPDMCDDCYNEALKNLQDIVEASDSETMLLVFNHLAELE